MPRLKPPIPSKKCKAKRQDGSPCRMWAIPGLEVCRYHGGGTRAAKEKAARVQEEAMAIATAQRLARKLGQAPSDPQPPADYILEQVYETAANVELYRMLLGELGLELERGQNIALPERVIQWDKGGTHVPARVHIWVEMYNSERERLVKFSKIALDANVDERRVRLAETQAQSLMRAVGMALDSWCKKYTVDSAARDDFRVMLAEQLRKLASGEQRRIEA